MALNIERMLEEFAVDSIVEHTKSERDLQPGRA
jgi:hypothetical protein